MSKKRSRRIWDRILTLIIVSMLVVGAALIAIPRYNIWQQDRISQQLLDNLGSEQTIWVDPNQLLANDEVYDIYVPDEDAPDGYVILESIQADRLRAREAAMENLNADETEDTSGKIAINAYGRLTIPGISVDLPLMDHLDHIKLRYGAVHYENTVQPGEVGYSAIFGHRRWGDKRMLTRLDEVKPGDHFTIQIGETVHHYQVDRNISVLPEEIFSYFNQKTSGRHVILVTCDPIPTWTHRMLVIAHQTHTSAAG